MQDTMHWAYVSWFVYVGITMIYLAVYEASTRTFSVLAVKLFFVGLVIQTFDNWHEMGLLITGFGVFLAVGACITIAQKYDSESDDAAGK